MRILTSWEVGSVFGMDWMRNNEHIEEKEELTSKRIGIL